MKTTEHRNSTHALAPLLAVLAVLASACQSSDAIDTIVVDDPRGAFELDVLGVDLDADAHRAVYHVMAPSGAYDVDVALDDPGDRVVRMPDGEVAAALVEDGGRTIACADEDCLDGPLALELTGPGADGRRDLRYLLGVDFVHLFASPDERSDALRAYLPASPQTDATEPPYAPGEDAITYWGDQDAACVGAVDFIDLPIEGVVVLCYSMTCENAPPGAISEQTYCVSFAA